LVAGCWVRVDSGRLLERRSDDDGVPLGRAVWSPVSLFVNGCWVRVDSGHPFEGAATMTAFPSVGRLVAGFVVGHRLSGAV
jgi:hypothetical protein